MQWLSVSDLSPLNTIPTDYLFVLVKAYLDGGNQADSTQYKAVTLASLVGRTTEWKRLERAWTALLHSKGIGIDHLHTTDAVTFNGEFKREKGWNETKRDTCLNKFADALCGSVIEHGKSVKPAGLMPYTITVVLEDFKQYRAENPSGPQDVTEILATCAYWHTMGCFDFFRADFVQMFFDRNEPYYGHIKDRATNPRFVRDANANGFDLERRVIVGPELDMRSVPALQAVDLLAYCIGNSDNVRFSWQQKVLGMNRMNEWLNQSTLDIDFEKYNRSVSRYKFPRRRPTR